MTFKDIVGTIIELLGQVVLLVIGLGLIVFLYGIVTYLTSYSDEKKRSESLKYIMYGLLGLFVMVSVWGIVSLVTGTFGLENAIPQIKI